ncbi:MAG TPA: recombinase family protein [Streptosporangiaceae bacterium]|nr:recombinase family protein [Streptosporangiaceae bacterium]
MFTQTAASKVTAAHLSRTAILYVRQSTLKQVIHNAESAHRQYDLRGRALALGWAGEQITVIDIDQGHSGASAADREGFQHLVAEVSLGRAGIVLGLECSRLARNSADWHQLLELCGLTGTLICDEDGLYDPRDFNDRLVLGMKGQISEAELHFIRARLRGGVLSKARRGELITPLPVGLVYDATGHIVLDPDTAVQQAVRHLFATFAATGSAFGCVKAFNQAGLSFPWRHQTGPRKGELDWKPLRHHTVRRILHNPRYAGAFTYGRRRDRKLPGGKTVTTVLPREEWISFIPGAHPGYITLAEFDANCAKLAANAPARGRDRAAGPPREGPALLQGIIVCGTCGQRMTVRYHHHRGREFPTYRCQRDGIEHARPVCATIPGAGLDEQIGQLLIATLSPLAVEAALAVTAELEHRAAEAGRLRAAHVERARYHADLARRRYLAVDPANRLVAESLEADWNTALRALADAQRACGTARGHDTGQLTDAQRARIGQLVTDLPAIWNDPATPQRERKRIARLLLTDVTVHRDHDTITAHVRFPGGQHTTLTLPAPKPAPEQRRTPAEIIAAVDELLDQHTNGEIAGILNQRSLTSGTGQAFDADIVNHIIRAYHLRSRRQRLRETGMLTITEMAARLGVCTTTIKAWCRAGTVTGMRYNDKGEHLYHPPDPANPPAKHQGHRLPSQPAQTQQSHESSRRGAV